MIYTQNIKITKISQKKRDNQIEEWTKDLIPQKLNIQMRNKYFKICTTSLIIREI